MECRVRGALWREFEAKPEGFTVDIARLRTLVESDGEDRSPISSTEALQRIGRRIAKQQPYELDMGVLVRYERGLFTVLARKAKR